MPHNLTQFFLGASLGLALSVLPARAQQSGDTSQPRSPDKNTSTNVPDDSVVKANPAGSPYVELDSWIYPAIERLAALGYIHSEFLGMRPWTRIECARLIQGAAKQLDSGNSSSGEATRLQKELKEEFKAELGAMAGGKNRTIRVESVYANVTGINGTPLNDSYHFGQTIINNDGRPYQEGFNTWDGFSAYATGGRFTVYVRGEYQHAPSAPTYSLPVRDSGPAASPSIAPVRNGEMGRKAGLRASPQASLTFRSIDPQ